MDIVSLITPSTVIFYTLAAVIVASALGVALAPNILYSAFALLGTLGGVAGMYLLLGADFVGIAQVLIYVGGILVLILFAVLLTNKIGEVKLSNLSAGVMVAAPSSVALLAILLKTAIENHWPALDPRDVAAAPTTARLGDAFLKEYLLPFELSSLILLMCLVGAMVIARRAAKEGVKDVPSEIHDRLA